MKISLSDQIFGREVAVTWDKRDRYGRIIGKISVNHRDVCLEQIRRGMAWHYKQYARDQAPDDRGAYAEAEVAARAAQAASRLVTPNCSHSTRAPMAMASAAIAGISWLARKQSTTSTASGIARRLG